MSLFLNESVVAQLLTMDLALDAVGGEAFETVLKLLRIGGHQIAITSMGSRRVTFDLMDFYHQNLRLTGVDTMKLTGADIAAILDGLRLGFESGALRPQHYTAWPIERGVEAYGVVASGSGSGKQVFSFD